MTKQQFQLLLPYLNTTYTYGRLVRWMIADKNGRSVYCAFCGNIANGVGRKSVGHFNFDLPICKTHIRELSKSINQAPFFTQL